MQVFFHQLFDYDYQLNKRLMDALAHTQEVPQKALDLFSHILNAHHIWNKRLAGKTPELGVFQTHEPKAWEAIHEDNQRTTFGLIRNADGFEGSITYTNSKGDVYTNVVRDVLFHIVNHGTHHRGQINSILREAGLEPIPLDYIFYKR
ncbi:DinB family protein [Sediminicola luteus]|uniref:Damage-inducible protein DinB n=1 Tax=Sediminicola luteus TaxID=319238 RepID=A0A2A4GEA4_9FLAO|nr:DinB family protein [Sediminicola luteus]PCE66334.1 damage-inducible protein DinB [Sediminicola luteus]